MTMKSETLGEDERRVAQLYRRRLEFYPICCTLNTKLAAMERSTKQMDIHTIWLLALNNITNSAVAHKTVEYNAVWSLLETHQII